MNTWLRLHDRRWFWRVRSACDRLAFKTTRAMFARRESARAFRETASISGQLFALCRPSLFAAVITVILCQFAWLFLLGAANRVHAPRVYSWLKGVSTAVAANGSTTDTLLSVIASVCGIFLALYFTAVSVVAQAGFATAPNTVKDLLLREKVGNLYMRILTVLTCVTLILLGLHALGYQPSPISLLVALLLGVLGIISFMALGSRAFYFFDPSQLAHVVASDFLRAARMATVKGFRWHDRSYQAHYHKLATTDLTQAKHLVTLSLPGNQKSAEALSVVLENLTAMMGAYTSLKSRIPADSHWYAQSPQHKNWFLQDHSTVDMALRTQMHIQPTIVADRHWVESMFDGLLTTALDAMLKANAPEKVYESLLTLSAYMEGLGNALEISQGVKCVRSLRPTIDAHYAAMPTGKPAENVIDLAVFEAFSSCAISIAVGFFKHLHFGAPAKIAALLATPKWRTPSRMYSGTFPACMLRQLGQLDQCVNFERKAEGHPISPSWYLRQLALIDYCDSIQTGFVALLESFSDLAAIAAEWQTRNEPVIAASFAHNALHLHFKITGNLPGLRQTVETLHAFEIFKELPAKPWDWNAFDKRIASVHESLISILAQCLPGLSSDTEVSGRPDYFGQAYNTVCQSCHDALCENRPDLFAVLFPPLFESALRGHDNLRKILKDRDLSQAVAWASEPLLDIMALSGYAQLYSDLHRNPVLWTLCEAVWLDFLKLSTDAHAKIEFLANCQDSRRHVFRLYPRDVLRTAWAISMNQQLEKAGLLSASDLYGDRDNRRVAQAWTPLLRAYCRQGHHPGWDVIDVFLITFLLRHPLGAGITFRDVRRFASALKREEHPEPEPE